MSDNFKAKWIYKAEKYNERLYKDIQFYNSVSAMAKWFGRCMGGVRSGKREQRIKDAMF